MNKINVDNIDVFYVSKKEMTSAILSILINLYPIKNKLIKLNDAYVSLPLPLDLNIKCSDIKLLYDTYVEHPRKLISLDIDLLYKMNLKLVFLNEKVIELDDQKCLLLHLDKYFFNSLLDYIFLGVLALPSSRIFLYSLYPPGKA